MEGYMSETTAKSGVANALSAVLKRPVTQDELNENVNLFTDIGIDSITVMDFIIHLENQFKFTIDDEMLDVKLFERVGNLYNLLEKKSPTVKRNTASAQ